MPKNEKPSNPKYVSAEQCRQRQTLCSTEVKAEIKTIKNALVGEDMQGGLVKQVTVMKTKLDSATGIVKTVVLPIALSVIAALIGVWAANGFRLK